MTVNPKKLNLGVTQLKEAGLSKPNRHPKATQIGKALDTASLAASTQSRKLRLPLALKLLEEMPEPSGATEEKRLLGFRGESGCGWEWDLSERRMEEEGGVGLETHYCE